MFDSSVATLVINKITGIDLLYPLVSFLLVSHVCSINSSQDSVVVNEQHGLATVRAWV